MPTTTLEIPVSRREAPRARLLQLTAYDQHGNRLEGVAVTIAADDNGTLDGDAVLTERRIETGTHGIAYIQWWPRPNDGPPRDFTSSVTATCTKAQAILYLDDLYE